MSRRIFEQVRLPVALLLLLIAGFTFFPRDDEPQAGSDATPSIVAGQPDGVIISPTPEPIPSPSFTPVPTATSNPTPTPTPAPTAIADPTADPIADPTADPTPEPVAPGGAEVLACRSISGATCNGELGNLPPSAGTFTALVRFTDASAGDSYNAILDGPSGTIPGGAYVLQGSGDGYYYVTFQAGGLPAGEYTLTATRNGDAVDVTTFRKVGG